MFRLACSIGSTHRSCEDRFRLTALHCGVEDGGALCLGALPGLLPPGPRTPTRGTSHPKPLSGLGSLLHLSPGARLARPWTRAPLPAHVQFRLENVPQASGNGINLADGKTAT